MTENDDETTEAEAVVLGSCSHEMLIGNSDGSISKLVPMREGEPMPQGATSVATVKRGKDPGTVRVTHHPIRSGPVKVATPRYRSGWDATFKKQLDGSLN